MPSLSNVKIIDPRGPTRGTLVTLEVMLVALVLVLVLELDVCVLRVLLRRLVGGFMFHVDNLGYLRATCRCRANTKTSKWPCYEKI
jgi:hypothetical protein